jgi:GNAT superfamily N-acetyltransferase
MDVTYREIADGDKDQLLDLLAQLNPCDLPLPDEKTLAEVWADIRADKKIHCLVAEWEGKLVGSCTLVVIPNLTRGTMPYGVLENVVTHAEYRKQGIGRGILAHALAIAWKNNCYKVMLLTSKKDDETLRFYRNSGFEAGVKTGFIAYCSDFLRRSAPRGKERGVSNDE